ncbi:MAG: Flp family type IVb pilin [Terracidiphilus sp.]|jgi:Flp pilus assembly pilin Flp
MWLALSKIHLELQRLIQQEDGQDLVEYALIILVCVIACVASVGSFATLVVNLFNYINTNLPLI